MASLVKKNTAAGPTSTAERPRERIDMTEQESEALLKPYQDCMFEHGVDIRSSREQRTAKEQASGGMSAATSKDDARWTAAESACSQFYPLPAWEKDPANPEARDFARAVVVCLKNKGVRLVEVSSDGMSYAFGGEDNDARSISLGLEKAPECEREVAADMK
ncbi:hypothetical protein Kisp02_73230 [Kineosporia sp. NBRC 101731]|nr:hypothetical protein Kisp02_73230 [Kineosporia sp. NBRC 101731]